MPFPLYPHTRGFRVFGAVEVPPAALEVGAYLDNFAQSAEFNYTTVTEAWIVFSGGDYLNNGCHYNSIGVTSKASLVKPIRGNGLRYSTGSNIAARGLRVECRQYTAAGLGEWTYMGQFTGPGAPQTLPLPTVGAYYDIRFTNPTDATFYTVIDVLEVV